MADKPVKPKPMTVRQLINLLQQQPLDVPAVLAADPEGNEFRPVCSVDAQDEVEGFHGRVVVVWPR